MQRAKLPIQAANIPHAWSRPPAGTIKCNVDAACFNNNSIIGYGICFRDSSGSFMFGKSDYLYSSTTIIEAETIGFLEAIKMAILNGMSTAVFFELIVNLWLMHSPQTPTLLKNLVTSSPSVEVLYLPVPTL